MRLSKVELAAHEMSKLWGKELVARDESDDRLIISAQLEALIETVHRLVLAKKRKLQQETKKAGRPRVSTPSVLEFKKMQAKGMSLAAIAKEVGVDRKTVKNRLRE